MKVVLAGAYGHLGTDILYSLVRAGHEVVAADLMTRELPEIDGKFKSVKMDMTKPENLKGLCDGADVVITTVGLTKASATLSCYDIDYGANLNLLNEAKAAGVKNFAYISVLKADKAPHIPMLDAKAKLEVKIKESGLNWVIFRPTGYFYDIVHVFRPMVEKGTVTRRRRLGRTKQ